MARSSKIPKTQHIKYVQMTNCLINSVQTSLRTKKEPRIDIKSYFRSFDSLFRLNTK